MLVKREIILAKPETTYNVDALPDAANDAILVENLSSANEGARMVERNAVRASLAPLQQVFGGTLRSISFDVELKGAGAAYSATVKPEIGTLLRGCAFGETVDTTVGLESVTYSPVSGSHESLTFHYYQDGQLTIMTGARGTITGGLEGGNTGKLSFTFTGHTALPTDVALPVPSYDSTVPPVFINANFSIDTFAAVISALNFDIGNTIETPPYVNSPDGYGEIQIVNRDVSGSFDPEHELITTEAFESKWRGGTVMPLTTGLIGATQYNRYTVSMPAVYYRELSQADRNGIRTLDATFGAVEIATDDEIQIQFT